MCEASFGSSCDVGGGGVAVKFAYSSSSGNASFNNRLLPPQHTMPTISPPTITLTEDQIDDLLYYSRTNDIEELVSTLCTIKSALGEGVSEGDILLNAVDAESGNGVLHMAAANGHGGGFSST